MHRISLILSLLGCALMLGSSACAPEEDGLTATAAAIRAEELAAHVRILSHDLFEGRGTGVRGGELAELYIETMYRHYGLEPAFDDSYKQKVLLRGVTPDPEAEFQFIAPSGEKVGARHGEDFVAIFPFDGAYRSVEAELVYVGYGIVSEAWDWNDYKDFDAKGKILVMHVNEPRPDLEEMFEGRTLTYFGRWMYKYQEAARQGAAGVLLIHSDEDAGYAWAVVRNGWGGETFFLPDAPDVPPLEGWISGAMAESLMRLAGRELSELRASAQERDFQPVPLGVSLRFAAESKYREVVTHNVVGVVRGKAGPAEAEAVVFSAHHDHFGYNIEIDGDDIYNGAIDNGSALAALLGMAKICGTHPGELNHDVYFLACAAEEEGMLGSDFFARNPPIPAARIVANLNFEMTNVWDETDDMIAIGARYSDLEEIIDGVCQRHEMTISPDSAPEQGYFYRSDQLSFARAGIPAAWIDCGEKIRGKPEGYGKQLRDDYRANTYHKPSDEFDPEWSFAGTRQLMLLATEILLEIDKRTEPIGWKAHAAFSR